MSTNNLDYTISRLEEKVGEMEAEKLTNLEKTPHVLAQLDNLLQRVEDLENMRENEEQLAEKMAVLSSKLDRQLNQPLPSADLNLEHLFKKGLRITRMIGQILEIVSRSLDLTYESVVKITKENLSGEAKPPQPDNEYAETDSDTSKSANSQNTNLSALLQSVNTLVQGIASEAQKQSKNK